MRISIFLLLAGLFLSSATARAQKLSNNDWDIVIGNLVKENWKEASKACAGYLKSFSAKDDDYEVNQLRYMYIYSVGGMVGQNQISRKKALALVKKFEGCTLQLPSHPVKPDCLFNCLWYAEDDSTSLFTCSTNNDGTFIHAFEYFRMQQQPDVEAANGKFMYIEGVLQSIVLQGETLSAFKLVMKDCRLTGD